MIYLITTPAQLSLYARAINVLAGLAQPVRGTTVGGPDFVPLRYTGLGTPGWTDSVYRGSWVTADLSEACAQVSEDLLQYAGMQVDVGDGEIVTLPGLDVAVTDIPARFTEAQGAFWWDGKPLA